MRACFSAWSLVVILAAAVPVSSQNLPDIPLGNKQVRLEIVATGLAGGVGGEFQVSPTDIVPDGTGRMFVSTLGGVVRVIDAGGDLMPTPFLTKAQTGNTVPANGEWGMTSIAFHPDFAVPGAAGYGSFYTLTSEPANANGGLVDFSSPNNHQDVLKHWTMNDINDEVFSGTVREVMRVGQPQVPHNVVDLAFDDDGYLFIASGDGGQNPGNSQNLGSVHGKVLRIDPLNPLATDASRGAISANGKYRVPLDNPFAATPGALDEVWALGLRSPFRMNFDRDTGDLWVGDVGQSSREEINLVTAGGNFGWPSREGTLGTQPVGGIDPVFEYDHDEGLTVIGGFVYRGQDIPELTGLHVFADLGEGLPSARLFYGDPATGQEFEMRIDPLGDKFLGRLGPETGSLLPLPERIISIGQDANGELYLAAVGIDPRAGGGIDGMIVRLRISLTGDLNGDGFVGIEDLNLVLGSWNQSVPPGDPSGDPSGDGFVGIDDLNLVLGNWNAGNPPTIAVPEPGTLVGLAGLLALTSARRGRRVTGQPTPPVPAAACAGHR